MTNDNKFNKRNNRHGGFSNSRNNRFRKNSGSKNEMQKKDRISKRLSILGIASRREAEQMVLNGKIKVNGVECKDLTQLVSYEDKIAVNGKEIVNKPIRTRIFLMNKPAGYITSNSDPQGRKTIFELIPSKFGRLIAIGRLDYNTEGILLLTNNGELARIMEMPATGLKRVYYARVIGEINDDVKKKLDNLRHGIKIEGIEYGKMIVEINDYNKTRATLRIVIFEGKNNEIRRIMWHLGLKVVKLTRVQYGDFRLNGLPEGCVQESHFKIDIRGLERQASRNIKKYNKKNEKLKDGCVEEKKVENSQVVEDNATTNTTDEQNKDNKIADNEYKEEQNNNDVNKVESCEPNIENENIDLDCEPNNKSTEKENDND